MTSGLTGGALTDGAGSVDCARVGEGDGFGADLELIRRVCEETHGCAFPDGDAFAAVHEGSRGRDALRKVKWWLMDRGKYADIAAGQRRADVELAELYLTGAPRRDGGFEAHGVERARERLGPYTRARLPDWEACRAAAVGLDLTYLHPP